MQLSEALEQIDGMIDLVSALIVENQPESTEQAIRQLRDGMQAFAGLAQRFGAEQFTPENVQRMQAMFGRLTQMRGHISKVSAITGQQLASLIPEQSAHTPTAAPSSPAAPPRWRACTTSAVDLKKRAHGARLSVVCSKNPLQTPESPAVTAPEKIKAPHEALFCGRGGLRCRTGCGRRCRVVSGPASWCAGARWPGCATGRRAIR